MWKENKNAKKIILDEEKEAERLLSSPTGEINYNKLSLMAKYLYSKGMNKKNVYSKIIEYCRKSEVFNIIFFEKMISDVVRKSKIYTPKKSNFKISITKKEVDVIKTLSHRYYKIALYMLFVAKIEKYQSYKKEKKLKTISFRTYLNYDIESAMYSSGFETSKKEIFLIGEKLVDCGFGRPILGTYNWEVYCADFDSKDSEFVIDGDLDFDGQIKYYCIKCGNSCVKSKKHDFCESCYFVKVKEDTRKRVEKHRVGM